MNTTTQETTCPAFTTLMDVLDFVTDIQGHQLVEHDDYAHGACTLYCSDCGALLKTENRLDGGVCADADERMLAPCIEVLHTSYEFEVLL